MKQPALDILYEDNHLLALNKPAGLPTMGVAEDESSLVSLARQYIKRRYNKPGNVYLGIMSRLDALVSGVVLLARTSKAAARLTEQFRTRAVHKVYWAVVAGEIEPATGECVDWVAKNEAQQRMVVVKRTTAEAKEARLSYRRLAVLPIGSLLEIELETGRKHQIRLQLSARGFPILGDRKYGSQKSFPQGIALHARRLTVEHPVRMEAVELIAPLPATWRPLGVRE